MPRTVIIVIGPMCSGKSTFCQAAAKAGYLIANDDAIVTAVHGGIYGLYSKSLKPLYKGIELEIIRTGLALGRDVIVDRATNMNLHCRRKYIGLATSLDAQVLGILTPNHGPEEHARRRFSKNNRGLSYEHWLQAAQRHSLEFVKPTFAEGFTEIITLAEAYQRFIPVPEGVL